MAKEPSQNTKIHPKTGKQRLNQPKPPAPPANSPKITEKKASPSSPPPHKMRKNHLTPMPDPTAPATPDPTPTAQTAAKKTSRKSPGPIDEKTLGQLVKDQETINNVIAEVTGDPQLATDLASHFIGPEATIPMTLPNLQQLAQDAAAAAALGAGAVSDTADLRDVTEEERGDFSGAVAAIRSVQQRAKEKYEETHPDKLDAYYIGQPLATRRQISAAGAAIWLQIGTTDADNNPITPKDTLPGLDATRIAQVKTDLGEYAGVQTKQSGAQAEATGARGTFTERCAQILRRRRRVQLAIDAERPVSPENTALRKRVGLQADKGMS